MPALNLSSSLLFGTKVFCTSENLVFQVFTGAGAKNIKTMQTIF